MRFAGLVGNFLLLAVASSSALMSRSLYDACSLTCGCMHKVGSELAYQMGEMKISIAGLQNELFQAKYKIQDASSSNLDAIQRMEMENRNLTAILKAQINSITESHSAAQETIKNLKINNSISVCNGSAEEIAHLTVKLYNTKQNLSLCLSEISNLEDQLAEGNNEISRLRSLMLMEIENKPCDEDVKLSSAESEDDRFQREREEFINSTAAEKEELERKLEIAQNELLTANETIQRLQDEYNKLRAEMAKTKMMGEERSQRDKATDYITDGEPCDSVLELEQTIIENEAKKRTLQVELQKTNQTAENALERADDLQHKLDNANVKIQEMEESLQSAQQEVNNVSKIAEDLEETLQNISSSHESSTGTENQVQLEAAQKAAEEARENATRLLTELETKEQELEAVKERLEKEALCRKARQLSLISINKKKYLIVKHLKLNWTEGLDYCAGNGLELAILEQNTDLKAVMKATANITNWPYFWWVGASDIGRDPGDFQWLNGNPLPVNSTLWYAGFPNYYGKGEDTCVYFHTASIINYRLHDVNCSKKNKLICQLPTECY